MTTGFPVEFFLSVTRTLFTVASSSAFITFVGSGVLWRELVSVFAVSFLVMSRTGFESDIQIYFPGYWVQMLRITAKRVSAIMMNIESEWDFADKQRIRDSVSRNVSSIDSHYPIRSFRMIGVCASPYPAARIESECDFITHAFRQI